MESVVISEIDTKKADIQLLITERNECTVYIDWTNKVCVKFHDMKFTDLVTDTIAEIEFMQRQPTVRYMPKSMQLDFACMLGEIAVLAIMGNAEKVVEFLSIVKKYLLRRNGEISRRWQLQICLCFLPVLFLLPVIGSFFPGFFSSFSAGQYDFIFLMSGGLGAMLSMF